MTQNIFENATFGTLCETRDGGKAVYIAHLPYSEAHKILVQGFNFPFMYRNNGERKGHGKFESKYGSDLDIIKVS